MQSLIRIVAVGCLAFGFRIGAAAAQQYDPESFHLPAAVAGTAERVVHSRVEGVGDDVFEIKFESGPEWSRFELWGEAGGFGKSLIQFAIDKDGQTLNYSNMSRRGAITNQIERLGWGVGEIETSPLGALRALRRAIDRGDEVKTESLSNGHEKLTWTNTDVNQIHAVEIDPAAGEVVSLTTRTVGTQMEAINRYLDWEPLPGGLHYPMQIDWGVEPAGEDSPSGHVRITELRVLDKDDEPSPYELPVDAVIDNQITNQFISGSGERVDVSTDAGAPVQPPKKRKIVSLLILIAVLCAALAGVIFTLKRRGVM